jgi:DNA-binding CsgD family transcriptional regulator
MNSAARSASDAAETGQPYDRAGLARLLGHLCAEIGADHYLLIETMSDDGDGSIVACNWIFDAVRDTGAALIRRLADSPQATFLGQPPRLWRPGLEAGERGSIGPLDAARLDAAGHAELCCVRIRTGAATHAVVLSARALDTIDPTRLPSALLSLSYALSALFAGAPAAPQSPVSDRERECLRWVSEGKTAEEIATIVGVTTNTVSSYVNNAILKLSARNRAMAIANAIRTGVI